LKIKITNNNNNNTNNNNNDYESSLGFSTFYLQSILDILSILQNLYEKQKKIDNNNNYITISDEQQQEKLIQSLFKIIYEILISSYNTDNNPKFLELQNEYMKKKKKEINIKNYKINNNNNNTNKEKEISNENLKLDIENIQEEIRFMWLQEDKIISQICKFLENKNIFNTENLTKNILRLKKNAKNFSEKKDYFSLIIKKGLIFPKNFKAKFSIWDFFENLFFKNSENSENIFFKNFCFCYLYNNVFSKEMLLNCINNSEALISFSVILKKIFDYNFITEEFCVKNSENLTIDFKELIDFIMDLIINLGKYKDEKNSKGRK